jgi:4-amino-4-deoxy-L-arabinose transferase-like glycosyltransferase
MDSNLNKSMNKIKLAVLAAILILAAVLRFYKLDQVPPSLNWDEIAAGYNAYTIANWGADEYGNKFPLVFKSFEDDKHPVHIYLTAPIIKIFGLSDFSTRASNAAIGVLAVFAIYLLGKELFKNDIAGLFSALFLVVSPYAIHYSRGLWEANFALFFFIAGFALFYGGLKKNNWLIPLSFISWGLSFFSYHSAKVVVPPTVFFVCIIHFKELIKNKKVLIWSILVVLLFIGLTIKNPKILGFARINQTTFSKETTDKYGGYVKTVFNNYKGYFNYSYLFDRGDQNPRGSVKVIGQFYKIDLILSLVGLIVLVLKKKWKTLFILFSWLALSPVPGSVSTLETNSTRGIFMIAPVILLSAYGATTLILLIRKNWARAGIAAILITFLCWEAGHYLNYYFKTYPIKEAIEWQYGMKQIVEYVKAHPEYDEVYMTAERQEPYIFYLFYLKTPLPLYLSTFKYNETASRPANTIAGYSKFHFGLWDPIESRPISHVLYVVTPAEYTGLRYKPLFETVYAVKYPSGSDAYFLVTARSTFN